MSMIKTYCLACALFAVALRGYAAEADANRAWVDAAYQKALDSKLAIDPPEARAFWQSNGYKWFTALRIRSTDVDAEEFRFVVYEKYDGTLHGEITQPRGGSIRSQLIRLHMSSPSSSVGTLLRRIRVSRATVSDLAQLRQIVDALARIRITAIQSPDIIMDPVIYELSTAARSHSLHVYTIASPGHSDTTDPVVQWAELVTKELSAQLK